MDAVNKAKQLQQRFDQLPPGLAGKPQGSIQTGRFYSLTEQIKARNGSAQELRDMRVNLVGEAATQRLEQLDQQRSDWKQRVQSYLDERKTIVDSNMSASAKDQAIQQSSNSNSSSPHRNSNVYKHLKRFMTKEAPYPFLATSNT